MGVLKGLYWSSEDRSERSFFNSGVTESKWVWKKSGLGLDGFLSAPQRRFSQKGKRNSGKEWRRERERWRNAIKWQILARNKCWQHLAHKSDQTILSCFMWACKRNCHCHWYYLVMWFISLGNHFCVLAWFYVENTRLYADLNPNHKSGLTT